MRIFKKMPEFGTRRTRSGFLFRPLMIEDKNKMGEVKSTDFRWLEKATWVETWTRTLHRTGEVIGHWRPTSFVDGENIDDI